MGAFFILFVIVVAGRAMAFRRRFASPGSLPELALLLEDPLNDPLLRFPPDFTFVESEVHTVMSSFDVDDESL